MGTRANFASDGVAMKDDFNPGAMKRGKRENTSIRTNFTHNILQFTGWDIFFNLSCNYIFYPAIYMLPVGLTLFTSFYWAYGLYNYLD